jgi:hypothetical protein
MSVCAVCRFIMSCVVIILYCCFATADCSLNSLFSFLCIEYIPMIILLYIILFMVQYLDTAEMDDKMKEIEDYINTYSKAMQKVTSAAASVADKTAASAVIFRTFSEVCTAIGSNCDDEDDEFIRQFGLFLGSLSVNMSRNADEQVVKAKEPLEQQARTLLSIKAALQRQKAHKKNFIACAADKILCEKSEQKDPANLSKIESSKNSRGAVLTAKQEYLDASRSLLDNFDRVRDARVYDVIATAEALGGVELEACEKNGHVLADILDELSYDEDCE